MKLFLSTILALCAIGSSVTASPLPPPKRDADFNSVRTRLNHDHSGKKGDEPGKYFHESTFHPHYDGRFADRPLSYDEKRIHLTALIQTYLSTMNDIGAETWIMHGSLLGWFWNRKVMPWDSDIDVQMTEKSMEHLANYYNMTMHHFKLPGIPEGRDYMLEINPNWKNGSIADSLNMIDGRWVDTDTGLFIDITTLRPNLTAQAEGHEGYMMCKDRHHYNFTDIFPLRESVFEDIPVKIPYAYTDLLIEEYTHEALVVRDFENHHFDQTTMEWKPLSCVASNSCPKFRKPVSPKNHSPTIGGKNKEVLKSSSYGFRGSQAASRAALGRIFPGSPVESEVGKPPARHLQAEEQLSPPAEEERESKLEDMGHEESLPAEPNPLLDAVNNPQQTDI